MRLASAARSSSGSQLGWSGLAIDERGSNPVPGCFAGRGRSGTSGALAGLAGRRRPAEVGSPPGPLAPPRPRRRPCHPAGPPRRPRRRSALAARHGRPAGLLPAARRLAGRRPAARPAMNRPDRRRHAVGAHVLRAARNSLPTAAGRYGATAPTSLPWFHSTFLSDPGQAQAAPDRHQTTEAPECPARAHPDLARRRRPKLHGMQGSGVSGWANVLALHHPNVGRWTKLQRQRSGPPRLQAPGESSQRKGWLPAGTGVVAAAARAQPRSGHRRRRQAVVDASEPAYPDAIH
jgi:hypothetical protein